MGDNRVPNGRNGIRVDDCVRTMPLRDAVNGAIARSKSRADATASPGAGSAAWRVAKGIAAAIASFACLFATNAAGDSGTTRERTAVTLPGGEVWPRRTIRLVVPQAPGGTADVVARMLGDRLEATLGVPVVVDNRPGANGVIGTEFAKRAAPDGHTLLLAHRRRLTRWRRTRRWRRRSIRWPTSSRSPTSRGRPRSSSSAPRCPWRR